MYRLNYAFLLLFAASCTSSLNSAGYATIPNSKLVTLSDLVYEGAFRLPSNEFGASSMLYAQGPIAYNSDINSIFVVGHAHQQAIAEFLVPSLNASTVISELSMSPAPTQSFSKVLSRTLDNNPQNINRIAGMLYFNNKLIVNAYEYYDANGDVTHTTLLVDNDQDISGSTISGYFSLQGGVHAGGWMSPIPAEFQGQLDGEWIAGNASGEPIISRLSVGPTAFVFNPSDIGVKEPVPTTALLDFSLVNPLHDDISNESLTNDLWTHLSHAVYGFIPSGTRTYITIGYSGGHKSGVCYKCIPAGRTTNCPGYCAKDSSDYQLMYWLWDVNDLIKVKNGEIESHMVRPYEYGPMEAPFPATEIGGGSYDPRSGRLYLSLQRADKEQTTFGGDPPLIIAYKVKNSKQALPY
jgi:hypothetical protein